MKRALTSSLFYCLYINVATSAYQHMGISVYIYRMNRKVWLATLLLALLIAHSKAQPYPQNYFAAPVDMPLIIIGTFGEVRTDHFHSGIDIGTNEEEGK